MIKRITMPIVGESSKLLPHYKGPYVITEVLPNDRYRVSDIPGLQRTQTLNGTKLPNEDIDGHDDVCSEYKFTSLYIMQHCR